MKYPLPLIITMAVSCSACSILGGDRAPTIASLGKQTDTIKDIPVASSHQQATTAYREFLNTDDQTSARPQAMRRLADINLDADLLPQAGDALTDISQLQQQQSMDSIILYTQVLQRYPERKDNDAVLYQLSRAYDWVRCKW